MRLDEFGIDFIKSFEAFRSKPYLDQAGIWTIGYGHTRDTTDKTAPISETVAHDLFLFDVRPAEFAVSKQARIPLNQNEFTSLVSFTFNTGIAAFKDSTLLAKLNAGDKRGASKEFERWVHYKDRKTGEMLVSRGLRERRNKEKLLFLLSVSVAQSA